MAVTTESRRWLSYLNEHNLFASFLGHPEPVLRLHQLFRSFLLATLAENENFSAPALHQRAGQALESNGRIPEAIEHYVKAGEFEPAATLLEKISESLLHSGNWHNLSGWIDSLPQDILDEHPWLLVYEAWIVNEEGDPGKALELCHQTQKSFRRTGNSLGITWTRLTMGLAFRRKGLLDEAIDICQLALSHMPENSVDTRLQADVLKHLGLSLYQAGEFEDAIEHLTQALRTYELQGDIYGTAEVHDVLGQIHGLRGRHHDALSHLEAARQGYRRLNNRKSYSEVLNNIGVVYHKQGHLDLSREALQEALDEARRSSNLKPEAYCLASLGDLNRDAGNMPAALRTYEGALEKAVTAELAPLVPYPESTEGRPWGQPLKKPAGAPLNLG